MKQVVLVLLAIILAICPAASSASAAGTNAADFTGVWIGTFGSNRVDQTKIVLILQQHETTLTGTYLTGAGTQGVLWGTAQANGQAQFAAEQKSPGTPAKFTVNVKLSGQQLLFTYTGQAGGETEKGEGHAVKSTMEKAKITIK